MCRAFFLLLLGAALLLFTSPSGASSGAVSFAVVGDVHLALGSESRGMKMLAESERIFGLVIETLNAMPDLDFVVFNGDLVEVPTARSFERFTEMAGRLRMPYYVVLGNHDVPHDAPPPADRPRHLSKREVVRIFMGKGFDEEGRSWWSTTVEGWLHILGLDSTVSGWWGGNVPPEQLSWLQADLSRHGRELTIVFVHHALVEFWEGITLEEGFYVDNRYGVRELCERHPGVQCIVSSHLHVAAACVQGGVCYFSTPSVVSYPCGFAVFTVTPSMVRMATVQIPDEGLVAAARRLLPEDATWRRLFPPGAAGDRGLLEFLEAVKSVRLPLSPW